jgi:uncharacterized protein YdhG (YjbR/CyaY superfamily)
MAKRAAAKNDLAQKKAQVQRYLAAQPPKTRAALRSMRSAIRATVPKAIEHFSYGIPGFTLDGRTVIWYAGWKQHVSLYPMTAAIKRTFARELGRYEMSKGTVRFPLSERVPTTLVKRIAKAWAAEVRQLPPRGAKVGS